MESTNTTPFLNATEQTSQQEIKKKTQKTLSLDQALTQFARQELSQHHNPKPNTFRTCEINHLYKR